MHRIQTEIAIVFLIVLSMLFGCRSGNSYENGTGIIPTKPVDMSGYRNMNANDHVYQEISSEILTEMFRKGQSGYVLISKTNCIYCQNAVWVLNKAAKDANTLIYYVDANNPISENPGKDVRERLYKELCGYIDDALLADEYGKKGMYVPVILNIRNGKLVKYHVSLTESFNPNESSILTKEQEDDLYKIYQKVLQ